MAKFDILVQYVYTKHATVTVEAESAEDAKRKAMRNNAVINDINGAMIEQDFDFSDSYVMEVNEIEE
jgi:hypothetical protein